MHAVSNHMSVGRRNRQVLSVASVQRTAQELGAAAQVVLSGETGGALLTGEAGVDDHAVPFLQSRDP